MVKRPEDLDLDLDLDRQTDRPTNSMESALNWAYQHSFKKCSLWTARHNLIRSCRTFFFLAHMDLLRAS